MDKLLSERESTSVLLWKVINFREIAFTELVTSSKNYDQL